MQEDYYSGINIHHWSSKQWSSKQKWVLLYCVSLPLISIILLPFQSVDESRFVVFVACRTVTPWCSIRSVHFAEKMRLEWKVLNGWFETQPMMPGQVCVNSLAENSPLMPMIHVKVKVVRGDQGDPLNKNTISEALIHPSSSSLML